MNRLLAIILSVFLPSMSFGQDSPQYFQQQVDYLIDVRLDDQSHQLTGQVTLTYRNNSPDEITRIPFHLWPNAYAHKSTHFAEQQLRLGKVSFYYADSADLGSITGLEFRSDDKKLSFNPDPKFSDIGWVRLKTPLASGESVTMTTSFTVKIPASFSRLGHVEQSYQITQWYPKPAVYDHEGWHLMPYLDQGEFFSEFGDYEVNVTLPENYVVAATGLLVTESEKIFLEERVAWSNEQKRTTDVVEDDFPSSSREEKTITFKAEGVHDFAWFADKRFRVGKKEIRVDQKAIQCWTFYTASQSEQWQKATDYLVESVSYFSQHVGTYPWPHVTAVQAPGSAGVGMEYPMITLIGIEEDSFTLDQVIAHEVAHNWFYGMLASNERDHAWMDEGLASHFENAYLEHKYGRYNGKFIPQVLTRNTDLRDEQVLYQDLKRQGKLDPPSWDPFDQSDFSYLINAYETPMKAIQLLKAYIGSEKFEKGIKSYFNQWKFKHPGPADFESIFEDICECDLDWLIESMLAEGKSIDYEIQKVTGRQMTIVNHGEVAPPVQVLGYVGDSVIWNQWVDGVADTESIQLPNDKAERVTIYDSEYSLDINWKNNHYFTKSGAFKRGPLTLGLIGGVESSKENRIYVIPGLAMNRSDAAMIGVGLTNLRLPNPALRWALLPMYSFRGKNIVGLGEVRKDFALQSSLFDEMAIGVAAKKFSYQYDVNYDAVDFYEKIEGRITLRFRKPDRYHPVRQFLSFRFSNIHQDYIRGIDFENRIFVRDDRSYYVNELMFERTRDFVLNPSRLTVRVQQGSGFLRLTSKYKQKIAYEGKNKGFFVHAFGGVLAQNNNPKANVNFFFNGQTSTGFFSKDFLYDEILFNRNETSGILSQQVFLRDAELKTLSNAGISDNWMLGAGFSTSLPIPLPIHFYMDFALYDDPFEQKAKFSYSSGLAIVLAKDFIEVYFPIFESSDIRESITYVERDSYFERVSFLLNLKALHPFDLTDQYFEFLY